MMTVTGHDDHLLFGLFGVYLVFGQVGFHAFCQFTAGEHYAMFTGVTFQPYIGSKPYNGPLKGTARMRFTQTQVVVELQVREHVEIIPPRSIRVVLMACKRLGNISQPHGENFP
jgi:hypothetical protein